MEWYRKELKPEYLKLFSKEQRTFYDKIVETSSNPRYFQDIKKINGQKLAEEEILLSNVVLIITGTDLDAVTF